MDKFVEKINAYMRSQDMGKSCGHLVIGLSGGADSVCLLVVMRKIGYEITAVHINHHIRGKEADRDEHFCEELCDRLGIELKVYHKDIAGMAAEQGITVEEAGRAYRYQCFAEVADRYEGARIAVAHNKNDLAETIIFNMARGSGINGLSGIKPVRDRIIRPLLDTTREEIEGYLSSIGQDYVTDSTNLGCDYDRNKIRHIILPALKELNEQAVDHICELGSSAGEAYTYIEKEAQAVYATVANEEHEDMGGSVRLAVKLDIDALTKYEQVIIDQVIYMALAGVAGRRKDISRVHVRDVAALLYKPTGARVDLIYQMTARRSYDTLVIERAGGTFAEDAGYRQSIDAPGVYEIAGRGVLEVSISDNSPEISISKKIYTKMADYDKIKDTLCIRTPEEGDYIIIDDKGNSKKLNRVFIDCKVDRSKRMSWPVVAAGSEIIWAIGLRFSEAYKIDDSTVKIITMDYKSEGE